MTSAVQRLMTALIAAIATLVLAFGVQTLIAAPPPSVCDPNQPGYLGECPPLDSIQCDSRCREIFGTIGNQCGGGCCICAVK
jgi:hypothetical protein